MDLIRGLLEPEVSCCHGLLRILGYSFPGNKNGLDPLTQIQILTNPFAFPVPVVVHVVQVVVVNVRPGGTVVLFDVFCDRCGSCFGRGLLGGFPRVPS